VNNGIQTSATATWTVSTSGCSSAVTVQFNKSGNSVTMRIPTLVCASVSGSPQVLTATGTYPSGYAPTNGQQFSSGMVNNGTRLAAIFTMSTGGSFQWNTVPATTLTSNVQSGLDSPAPQHLTFTYALN
jgi:predicted extracellular nuclease